MERPKFSKKNSKKKKFFEDILNSYKKSLQDLENIKDLFELATLEKDEETIQDCIKKILNILLEIKKKEINCFLSGENDNYDIYLETRRRRRYRKSRLGRYASKNVHEMV